MFGALSIVTIGVGSALAYRDQSGTDCARTAAGDLRAACCLIAGLGLLGVRPAAPRLTVLQPFCF